MIDIQLQPITTLAGGRIRADVALVVTRHPSGATTRLHGAATAAGPAATLESGLVDAATRAAFAQVGSLDP